MIIDTENATDKGHIDMSYTHLFAPNGIIRGYGYGAPTEKVDLLSTYNAVVSEYGRVAANIAQRVAMIDDFSLFKNTMIALGYPEASPASSFGQNSQIPPVAIAALIMRYPFIANPTQEQGRPSLNSTILDCLPSGWVARFGLELLEDLFEVLTVSDGSCNEILSTYMVTQVKEKFGSLRWYDGFSRKVPESVEDAVEDVIHLYESYSGVVCADCGRMDHVYQMSGYIIPLCSSCISRDKSSAANKEFKEFLDECGCGDMLLTSTLREKAYEAMLDSKNVPANLDEPIKGTVKLKVFRPGEAEGEELDPYERLKEAHPDLRIFDLIGERDAAVLGYERTTREDIEAEVFGEKERIRKLTER